jgi:hypothetical protein
MKDRRVMLLIDVFLYRYDGFIGVLRGSELNSQPDLTELLMGCK